jgi:predicted RNase H-like HicB family nuclease
VLLPKLGGSGFYRRGTSLIYERHPMDYESNSSAHTNTNAARAHTLPNCGAGFLDAIVTAGKERENRMKLTALIEREGNGYVSLCPELDIASQGDTIESARDNLREALELFFQSASAEEIKQRLRDEVYITQLEVTVA